MLEKPRSRGGKPFCSPVQNIRHQYHTLKMILDDTSSRKPEGGRGAETPAVSNDKMREKAVDLCIPAVYGNLSFQRFNTDDPRDPTKAQCKI